MCKEQDKTVAINDLLEKSIRERIEALLLLPGVRDIMCLYGMNFSFKVDFQSISYSVLVIVEKDTVKAIVKEESEKDLSEK